MNIAQLRQQFPFLREFTDDEVAGALMAASGVNDPKDARYAPMQKELLGYDRTTGEKIKDAGIGLLQGALGLGQTAGTIQAAAIPGVKAFDNPVVNTIQGLSNKLDKFKSGGLQAQETGAQVANNIAVQNAAAEGSGLMGRIYAGAKAQAGSYIENPGMAVQDAITSAPTLLIGGVAGRAAEGGARLLGAGEKLAARVGTAGGVGGSAVAQGGDVASDTYTRMRQVGASYEDAATEAAKAGVKGGAATVGLAALPGAATIERSMLKGAAGPGGLRGAIKGAAGEFTSESLEEGYGRFAGNQAVQTTDPNADLANGVGQAAIQGGFAAGPLGGLAGRHHGAAPAAAPAPRTETGEIDLAAGPDYSQYDTPTFARRGLDPTFERSSPYTSGETIQAQGRDRALATPQVPGFLQNDQNIPAFLRAEPTMADIAGQPVNPVQRSESNVADLYEPATPNPFDAAATPAPQPLHPGPLNAQNPFDGNFPATQSAGAPAATTPLESAPNLQTEPGAAPARGNNVEFTRDIDTGNLALADTQQPQAVTPSKPAAPVKTTVGQVLVALEKANSALGKNVIRKDGQVSQGSAAAPIRSILESKAPVEVMRSMYQDGKGARDELLDVWHKELTGQTIAEAKAAEQPAVVQAPAPAPAPAEATATTAAPAAVAPAPAQVQELAPKKPTVAERKISARVDGAGAAMDGLGLAANPHKVGTVAHREWIEGHDEVKARAEAAKENPIAKKLVQTVESTKDESLYDESLYALYKLAARGDVTAFNYFQNNGYYDDISANGKKLKPAQAAEMAKLRTRWQTERGQERGKKFGVDRFRNRESAAKGQASEADLQAVLDQVRKAVPGAPKIEVADNPEAAGMKGPPGGEVPMGVTTKDGRIVLFRHGLANRLEAMQTAFHELFHRGLAELLPRPEYHAAMDRLYASDPLVQKYAHEWGFTDEARSRQHLGMSNRDLRSLAIEEGLARVAEDLRTANGLGKGRARTVRNVVSWMASIAQHLGMRDLAQWLRRTTMTQAEKFVTDAIAANDNSPSGPSGGERFNTRNDETGASGDAAIQMRLKKQVADYRSLAQQALARGKLETAQSMMETAQRYEAKLDSLAGGDAKFSVRREPETIKPFAEGARSLAATVKAQLKGEELNEPLLNMLTLRQIDEQFGSKLPALRDWVNVVMERSSTASKLAAEADRIALQWQQQVPKAEMKPLAEILLRASNAELQLDNNSAEYLATLNESERREHTELRTKLKALSPAAKQARTDALAVLKKQWELTRASLTKFITLTVPDPALRAKRLNDLNQEFGRNHGDYFPMSRFGDRVVIARAAAKDGRDIVTFHESPKSVEDEVRRLKDSGVKSDNIIVTMSTEYDPRKVPGTGFVRELHGMIDNIASGDEARQLHQTLQQLYLKSLPELSGAKHMVRRENIEGYSHDALRAFADAVTRGSHYASHLEFGPAVHAAMEAAEVQSRSSDKRSAAVVIGRKDGAQPLVKVVGTGTERLRAVEKMAEDGYAVEFFSAHPETVAERLAGALEHATPEQLAGWIKQVREAVKKSGEGVEDLRAAKQLYNYMVRSQKADINPDTGKAVELAGQLGYAWYLGFSPAFWAMNSLQNPMIGIPHLGAKYGVGKSSTEWMRAASWFAKVRIGKRLAKATEPFSVEWLRDQVNAGELKGINKEELDMLQRLEDRQVLDFTQAMDLSKIGAASNSKWYSAMRLAAAGAHHTEVFNRVSFALASYRLAMKSRADMTHEEAARAAEKDVASVHFDYSYANKPLWMGKSSPAMRLVFMFQQYRQHMLYWWANTIKDATKGDTPEERGRARKAALLMGTTQLMFAGTMGLPFMGAVGVLANVLGGGGDDGDEPFDFERWMREAALGMTGSEKGADVVLKGVFAAMGADVSKRIGQQDLLPLLNPGSARYERDFDDKTRAYLFDMLGPLGSMALGAARATEAFSTGDYMRGLQATMPKTVADILRSYQQGVEGLKDKRGQQLATEEAFDGWDKAMQAAGITPTSVANAKQARGTVLDIQHELSDQSKRLTGAFIQAWSHGDNQGMSEALADIQRYNQGIAKGRTPARELLITPDRLRSAIVERQRRAMLLALTGGLADTRQQLLIATRVSGMYDLQGRDAKLDANGLPALPGVGE